jgi:hypothetical protein
MEKKIELGAARRLQQFVGAMANLNPKDTGIPNLVVWISKKEPSHACRVKVSNIRGRYSSDDNFTIEIHDGSIEGEVKVTSKDVKNVLSWMTLNRKTILKFWNDDQYGALDLARDLKKI